MNEKFKLIQKDIRRYDKDTLITSFFATITVLLLVIIILNCDLISNAQSVDATSTGGTSASYDDDSSNMTNLNDLYNIDVDSTIPQGLLNYNDSDIQHTSEFSDDALNVYQLTSVNADIYNDVLNYLDISIPEQFTYDGVSYNISDFPNFALISTGMAGNNLPSFNIVFSDSSFIYLFGGAYDSEYQFTTDSSNHFIFETYDGSLKIRKGVQANYNYNSRFNYDFQKVAYNCSVGNSSLIYANCSINGATFRWNANDQNNDFDTPDGFEYNYLNGQSGNGGSGGSSGETQENNMYLKSADFKFNIHQYGELINDGSSNEDFAKSNMTYKNYWGNKSGLIDFEAVLTDYQIEHSEDYYLYFSFTLMQRFDALGPTINDNISGPVYSGFKKHSVNTATTTNFYSKTYLDDFIDNGNRITWNMQDLFSDLKVTDFNTPYINTQVGNSFSQVVGQERELAGIVWASDNNLGYVIICNAYLNYDGETYYDAGSYTERYGFCSQVSKNTDSTITDNPNPYIPSGDNDGTGDSDNSDSTIKSDGNISLINNNYDNDNNNQSVVINNDDSELVDNLTDKFIPNTDGTGGLTNTFKDLANTNGFIAFMNSTFSAIPNFVWNTLNVLLGSVCTIIAVGFVIKVLRGM